MSASLSPYMPGFGRVPPLLAGRQAIVDAAGVAMAEATSGRRPRPIVVTGPRGMGKTTLLEAMTDEAARQGWQRVWVEATSPAAASVLAARARSLATLGARRTKRRRLLGVREATLRVGAAGTGIDVTLGRVEQPDQPGAGDLEAALEMLGTAAAARGQGVLVVIDEAQATGREGLMEIGSAMQEAARAKLPFVFLFGGLPSLQNPRQRVSYLERGEWHWLGVLDEASTAIALSEPARKAGRPFEADAADYLVAASGGYPYAVQLYGHYAWVASEGRDTIDLSSARSGVERAAEELAVGLYSARWLDASANEQRYLVAVAELRARGERPTGASVAERLGMSTQQLSSYRDRLLKKGTLVAKGTELDFVVPGMATYVLAQAHDGEGPGPVQGTPHLQSRSETPSTLRPPESPSRTHSQRPGPALGR